MKQEGFTILFIPEAIVKSMDNPDHLSTATTVFRNGGIQDGTSAVPFVMLDDKLKRLLREYRHKGEPSDV